MPYASTPAAVYRIESQDRIALRRGNAMLSFEEGKLAFFLRLMDELLERFFPAAAMRFRPRAIP